jgi:hypothetical protein
MRKIISNFISLSVSLAVILIPLFLIAEISAPPKDDNLSIQSQQYFKDIYENLKNISSNFSFLTLSDTPNSYSGQANKTVKVNSGETALEFINVTSTDEKVKADSADSTADYLANKTDNTTVAVNTTSHQLYVIHGSSAYNSGSGSWTAPTGISKIFITLCGGGGGGANGNGSAGGGGGGGAEAIVNFLYNVTAGSSYAYSVGAGGGTGATGSDTTFGTGTVITANGGGAGVAGSAGSGASNTINASGSTAGGYGSLSGGNGATSGMNGGGGGGSYFGAGGAGQPSENGNGTAATGYGAGGGGAGKSGGTGGAGSGGVVLVVY